MKLPISHLSLISLIVLSICAPCFAAQADIGLVGRIHFNTQTADFARTRAFYRLLGYTEGQNNYPRKNTHQMARSLGMYDLCTSEIEHIEVMQIPDSRGSTSIDLIQFAVPYNDEPPYASINHLGMAYAALQTTNLAKDYAYLQSQGVSFLSQPYGVPGNQFVFFKDPDGVFLKLVESSAPEPSDRDINIVAMPYIGINVSDLDRALQFYQRFGYEKIADLPATGNIEESHAYGFNEPFRIKGADIAIATGDQHRLRLVQWLAPQNSAPPYPAPISHIGIHRIALAVTNLDHAVARLSEQGVEFLSAIAPCCSGTGKDEIGIINAVDPDGTFLELVGPIKQRPAQASPADCK
jgi:catechol 2,3-dioxygenase-like lactoylglutathione lyase family enzyme